MKWNGACRLLVAVTILASFFAGVGEAQEAQVASGRSPGGEALAPGDAIELGFWRDPGLNGQYVVDEAGHAVLPFLGKVRVDDSPVAALRARLEEALRNHLNNQDVQITFLRRVRVLGWVNDPGVYLADPSMTVSDVLALAGGPSRDGDAGAVRVRRGGGETELTLGQGKSLTELLRSGDEIYVPQSGWLSRGSNNATVLVAGLISAVAIIFRR